jgi:hypothetical protein
MPLHRRPDRVRFELRQDHGRVPGEQAGQRGHHGGPVDERRGRHRDHAVVLGPGARLRPLVVEGLAGDEVDAAAERAPDVLVPPHHPLRVAGGPPGVDDVDVVGAARAEVAGGRRRQHRLAVVSADRHPRQPGRHHRVDDRRQVLVVDERAQVGVAQVIRQLALQAAEVDVDGDRPELDRRQQRRHRLDRVTGVEADVPARADALGGQVVGEPVGLVLELAVGDLQVAVDQRDPVGERVGGVLEDIGHIQCHG